MGHVFSVGLEDQMVKAFISSSVAWKLSGPSGSGFHGAIVRNTNGGRRSPAV